MNNEELKQARKQYRNLVKEKKELIAKKEELEKLKNSKEVLKYLELIKYDNIEIKNEETILDESFSHIAYNTSDDKNTYVYMGSFYQRDPLENPIFIKHKRSLRKLDNYYNKYWNLETTAALFIEKKDISKFVTENNIIEFEIPIDIRDEFIYHDKFYELRIQYFKLLTYTTKEKAISRIKARARTLVKKKFFFNLEHFFVTH